MIKGIKSCLTSRGRAAFDDVIMCGDCKSFLDKNGEQLSKEQQVALKNYEGLLELKICNKCVEEYK